MAYDTRQKTSQRQGYDITGKMLRDYKNRNGGSAMTPAKPVATMSAQPVATPLRDESSAMRDRLRMQITGEQQKLLADRRAGKIARGDGTDTESLSNIAALRREMAGYDSAARPSQRPNTPEQNMMASRDAADQAAKIMQGDLAAMEQKVYTMPPGPMRDAEVEKLRAFKDKTNEQFVKGNVLRPEDTGPPVPGSSSTDYADAMATAEGQTASQMEAAGRDYDRRQNVLGFTKEMTAKRLAEEQRAKDAKTAQYEAGLAEIRRPQDEFRLRQDAVTTEMRAREAAIKEAERKSSRNDALTDAQITAAKWDVDPNNPKNRGDSAKADVLTAQAASEMRRINRGGLNAQDMAEADAQFANAGASDADVEGAMGALRDVTSQISDGRYVGTDITGNAEKGLRAVAKIGTVVQGLKSVAAVNPEKARSQARKMLAEMQQLAGSNQPNTGMLAAAGTGAAGGALVGSAFPGIGTAIGAAVGGVGAMLAQGLGANMNKADRDRLVRDWNQMYSDLQQIAGQ